MNTNLSSAVDDSAFERRELHRIPLDCNALVRLAEYLTFRAKLRNISTHAVQIECDPRYGLLIHPGGVDTPPDEARHIDISIALPELGEAGELKASCRAKYCTGADNGAMLLGLQFVSMDFVSVQYLDRFIESQ